MNLLLLFAAALCFWPVVAIGLPFVLYLRDARFLRFRLRHLLATTTLLALSMGLAAYALRT